MTERDYGAYPRGEDPGTQTGKFQYWESILGKAKVTQMAEGNEKVRFHLKGAPYSVSGRNRLPEDAVGGTWDPKKRKILALGDEKCLFAPFYELFLQDAVSRLRLKKETLSVRCSKNVEQDFIRYALRCLQKISIRALILEMRQLKAQGKLLVDDEAGEYQDFIRRYLGDLSYIRMLYERYPILFRMMWEQTGQCLEYFCGIIGHLETDKEEIERLLGSKVFELSGIRCMYGDAHHHGKSVACVRLNKTAEIMYKPHQLENERIFQDLLKRIGEKCALWDDGMGLRMIGRTDHGWAEKICFQECGTEPEIKRFYERAGMLVFLTYLLGASDLHCENMIAKGEYPVLIDLENLIRLRGQGAGKGWISDSVLGSGILPTYLPGENGMGNEVGALSGEGGKKSKMQVPDIRDAYSSKMRIEYRCGLIGHTQNRVKYQGRPVEAAKYLKELISGFRKAYRCVKDDPGIQKDILDRVESCRSRQLISDTMKYAAMLSSASHPDLLTDGGDRELFIRSVGVIGKERDQRLVECEVEAMLRGDIPCFSNEGRHLACGNKICIPDYFTDAPRQAVQKRIMRLSQRDEQFQVKLMELSVTIAGKIGKNMINSGRERIGPQREAMGRGNPEAVFLSICEKIEGLILDNVYEDEDGNLQILSIDMLEQSRNKIRRVSRYFYEGTAGIALFLYTLEKERARLRKSVPDQEGKARTGKKVAGRLLGQLKAYTESLAGSEEGSGAAFEGAGQTGLCDGEFTIVFVYLLLYEIGKEEEYLRLARIHAQRAVPLMQKDRNFDLLGGNAGGIAALLKMYGATEDERYLTAAAAAGDMLCSQAVKMECGIGWAGSGETPLCGMAHGNSGILIALARLYQKTGDRTFYEACLKCLDYEESMYSEEFHDWKDLRGEAARYGHVDGHEISWCHGAGGIALSRALAIEALSEREDEESERMADCLERDIKRAVPELEEHFLRQGMCVCHGTLGNYQILKKLRRYLDGRMMDRAKSEVYAQILCLEKEEPELLVQEYHAPGFMNGLAGIGYYLLKEIDEGLPDILEL